MNNYNIINLFGFSMFADEALHVCEQNSIEKEPIFQNSTGKESIFENSIRNPYLRTV